MITQIHPELSNERQALLYEVFQTFNSSLDLDQVLNNVIEKIKTALIEHIAEREQFDDITLMAIRRERESS